MLPLGTTTRFWTMRDLDLILGTHLKVRLVRAVTRLGAPISARQATRLAGVSVKGVETMDELSKMGIVDKREGTAQNFYQLEAEHYLAEPIKALFAAEEAKLQEVAALLREQLRDQPAVVSGAIFGSSARGEPRPDSDLDVLVLVSESAAAEGVLDRLLDAAPGLRKRFGARLSPFILDVEGWSTRAASGDPFLLRAAREAIPFIGDHTLLALDG
jgi:predicted nucleotidyltransferase